MSLAWTIDVARAEERGAAFQLIFQHLRRGEREARVGNALRLINLGEVDPSGLLVVRQGSRLLGAMICLPVAGASGLVWPPQLADGMESRELEDRLVQHALAWLRQRGAKLAQSLLAADELHLAASLERNGFQHLGSLLYLRHDLALPAQAVPPVRGLTYEPYPTSDQAAFYQTLLRTYEGTQDCPEVNGVRTLDEILEGHRAQGVHNPALWWLVRAQGQPAAVLLLTSMPEWQGLDVAYLGVVPEARRRGIGRDLARKALEEARGFGAAQLTLAVDARNLPAWNLYRGLGFEVYGQREVYLAIWLS